MGKLTQDGFNLSKKIAFLASLVMSIHPVSREWRVAIVSLALARVLTMVITAYSAYFYFFTNIQPVIKVNHVSKFITILILILVEILTAVFLDKTFKFLFRKRFLTAVFALLIVFGFYSIQFISTTNGLANRQSLKKDHSMELIKENTILKEEAKNEFRSAISGIDTLIKDIKANPASWSKRKRNILTLEQQSNLINLEKQKSMLKQDLVAHLDKIEKQLQEKLRINEVISKQTGNQYYKFMEIVMIAQFFITGILIYLFHLIQMQEHKEEIVIDELNSIKKIIQKHTFSYISSGVAEAAAKFAEYMNISEPTKYSSVQKLDYKSEHINNRSGHKPRDKCTKEKTSSKDNKLLAKHKNLVRAIMMNVDKNQNYLSNADIKNKILPMAKNAKYKSYSLIRKVFNELKSVDLLPMN